MDNQPLSPSLSPTGDFEGTAPPPRLLPAGDGAAWWGESWRIFCAAPLAWIGILVVFVALSWLIMKIPIIGSPAHAVLTPVFAGGVMLGCHALAGGRPLSVAHLFEGFRGDHVAPLLTLGLIWLALLIGVAVLVVGTAFIALGIAGVAALVNFASSPIDYYFALTTAGLWIAVIALVALTLLFLAAMAYWFAPALVVLNGEPPLSALSKSFAASWRNFGAFLLYGLIYVGLAIAATIPLMLGWLVLGPMLVGSCYAGWRTIFGK